MENKETEEDKDLKKGANFIAILLSVPVMLLRGVVLKYFWNWFIILAIPQIPEITMGLAIGVSMCFGLMQGYRASPYKPKEEKKWHDSLHDKVIRTFYYLLAWGIAFIVHLCITP